MNLFNNKMKATKSSLNILNIIEDSDKNIYKHKKIKTNINEELDEDGFTKFSKIKLCILYF